ncbi:MAG: cytochrome c-type biogenesis protein CcmH [Gemmatimonadaceae bacterium]|nr:cytochrome c-type biogenesis protein CcmH [Gemmatimonadaceae bacterium]
MRRTLVALALAVAGAGAQAVPESLPPRADSALEARTSAVAAQLRCPVCQGVSIQDSPAELAQQMRGVVRDQLAAGRSPEEVKAYFISKYGEWILLEPEARGFNLLAYGLPALLIVVGLGVVAVVVRRNSARAPAPASAAVGVDEEP